MNRGQHGGSLADRAARSGVPVPPAADTPRSAVTGAEAAPAARRPAGEGHGRHCWVHDPPDAPGTWPGLLVEWRQREGSWHGRVAYTVIGRHGPVLVEAWLPAAQLEQG
jgi:hypothetical protein